MTRTPFEGVFENDGHQPVTPPAGTARSSRSQPSAGFTSRPNAGASRPGTQQPSTRVTQQARRSLTQTSKYQQQHGPVLLSDPQEATGCTPSSRLQMVQQTSSAQQHVLPMQPNAQQHLDCRPNSRLGNSVCMAGEGISSVGSSLVGPASISRCATDYRCTSRCGHSYPEDVASSMSSLGSPTQLQHAMQSEPHAGYAALHQHNHQQGANPPDTVAHHAVALWSSSDLLLEMPQRREHTPLAGQGAGPLYTPRRQAAAALLAAPTAAPVGSYAAAAIRVPTPLRPTSSKGHKALNSIPRNSGSGFQTAILRTAHGTASRAGTAATANPAAAPTRVGSARPNSSSPWQASLWQQQSQGHKQLPAGALSQDPVGPTLAAYLGSSHGLENSAGRYSTSSSRPGSTASRATSAAAAVPRALAGLSSSRNSSRPLQQPRPGSKASPASAASLLYTPRVSRPTSSKVRRPESVNRQLQQQQQEQMRQAAAGPLLSDYFRPPSAAAPGGVGLFGLPGMEPPGVSPGGVPCVRVPSVHASWDASAAGLSIDLSSSSSEQQQLDVTDSITVAVPPHASERYGVASGQQQSMQQQAENDKMNAYNGLCRPSSSRGQGAVIGSGDINSQPEQSQGLNCDGTDKGQLLLWSAAHEIDGRPVTRNGERLRPPSCSKMCNC